jgi:hypothetical protein
MADKRPGIPQIDPSIPQNIAKVLAPLKEHAEIAQGVRSSGANGVGYAGWKRRSVTLGMLIEAGVISEAKARELYDMV